MSYLGPKVEVPSDDAPPIWEQLINEIVETRLEVSKRLDRLEPILRETHARLRDVKNRLDKIERKLPS